MPTELLSQTDNKTTKTVVELRLSKSPIPITEVTLSRVSTWMGDRLGIRDVVDIKIVIVCDIKSFDILRRSLKCDG